MTKRFHVSTLCQALVDIVFRVDFSELQSLGLEPGSRAVVSVQERNALIERLGDRAREERVGGSLANTILTLARLGSKTTLVTALGNDPAGSAFSDEFRRNGVELRAVTRPSAMTGTVLVFITPDGERTMRTCLGEGTAMDAGLCESAPSTESDWLFLGTYLLQSGPDAPDLMSRMMDSSRAAGGKVVFTLGASALVERRRQELLKMLPSIDLLVGNTAEAAALMGLADASAFEARQLASTVSRFAITDGSRGAWIGESGAVEFIPAVRCTPLDLTGAGDTFCAGLIQGLLEGQSISDAAVRSHALTSFVISTPGSRPVTELAAIWDSNAPARRR